MSDYNDPLLGPVLEVLSGGFDVDRLLEISRRIGDDVHAQVKAQLVALPTVREGIFLGLHVAVQVLLETAEFADRSAEGGEDGALVVSATFQMFRDLVEAERPGAFDPVLQ